MPLTRLGIAGLGWLGESLLKDVPRVGGFEVVAVQDVRGERAREVADGYGVVWWGDEYEALLARPEVDAVLIATPNGVHASQAQSALLAGKDVLVQKPLALSWADAQATVEFGQRSGRLLFVDYTYRYLETVRRLRTELAALPRPVALHAAFHNIYGPGVEKAWFFDRAQAGGGALMDLGVHLIDLGLWLLSPSSMEIVDSEVADERPVEHAADVRLRLDDVPFDVAVSWNAERPLTDIFFEVETSDGTLRWENVEGSFFRFRTVRDGSVLIDRETSLREDTLRAFAEALDFRRQPRIDKPPDGRSRQLPADLHPSWDTTA